MIEAHHPTAEQLEALADGALDRSDRVTVESHLLGCAGCRTAADEWRALFAALADLPQLEPSLGFADRVMADVRIAAGARWQHAWQAGWQQSAARAAALIERVAPKSTFGWALATAMLALPVILGGGIVAWIFSKSYLTPATLWAWTSETLVQGLQGLGQTAIAAVMQSGIAAWTVARATEFVNTAGITGLGTLAAVAGMTTMLSIWILYRNLFRTPTRETDYATYSF